MRLRQFVPADAPHLARLFFNTIHKINARDYTPEQLAAWAPADRDMEAWAKSFDGKYVLLAESDADIAGFGELEADGHIDRFYIADRFVGQGVGAQIYAGLEARARELGLKRLFVEASITAKNFFSRMGFNVIREQTVRRAGVGLNNFVMEKILPPQKDLPT